MAHMDHIYVPHFLFACGLSHDRPKEAVWLAKSGVRLMGRGHDGVPYGRARAIILYLASHSAQSGRRISGSLDEICAMFGVDWSNDNLEQHFRRILDCEYRYVVASCICGEKDCHQALLLDVIRHAHYCATSRTFVIELGDALMVRSLDGGFPCPMQPVRILIQAERLQTAGSLPLVSVEACPSGS